MSVAYDGFETVLEPPAVLARATGFRSRDDLLSDLANVLEPRPELPAKVLAIFALDGFQETVDKLGRSESEALLSGLAGRLEREVGGAGAWYRPRKDEFALLCDAEDPSLPPLLDRAVAALSEPGRTVPVSAAFGSVVVPEEAGEPIAALRLADQRLAAAQPGRPPRDRRRDLRPGQPDREAALAVPLPEPLAAIHSELVQAYATARRARMVDQLLDVAGTLTTLADAMRIDDREAGALHGQPRDAARIPLLLKELHLKLAALSALKGPEIVEATKLVQLRSSYAPGMSASVLAALDEIGAALAAA